MENRHPIALEQAACATGPSPKVGPFSWRTPPFQQGASPCLPLSPRRCRRHFSPMARGQVLLGKRKGSHAPTGPSPAVIWNWGDLRVGSHPGGGGETGFVIHQPRVIAVTNNLETWRESGLHSSRSPCWQRWTGAATAGAGKMRGLELVRPAHSARASLRCQSPVHRLLAGGTMLLPAPGTTGPLTPHPAGCRASPRHLSSAGGGDQPPPAPVDGAGSAGGRTVTKLSLFVILSGPG